MDLPAVVSRDEWLAARVELLAEEKAVTRAWDAAAARRRALPMVEVTEEYVFDGPDGPVMLLDMFEGRRQLIIYHFMFGPDDDHGHSACSILVDSIGHPAHLHARDTTIALVSRAPIAKLEPFRHRMDWTIPWYSSTGNRWNYDFHATMDETVAPVQYNYRDAETLRAAGKPWYTSGDWHGLSVFLRDGERIFHTYSTFERGLDHLLSPYNYLDLTPLGRQDGIDDFKLHDTYTPAELGGTATDTAPVDVATAFIDAFGRGDLDAMADYLADDIVFESPRVRITGVQAVLAAMGEFAKAVQGVDIVTALGDRGTAVIVYDMKTVPFGTLRAVDHLVVRDGKIRSDTLVFDTYELRKAEQGGT